MPKYGIRLKIDVTKIEKARMFTGQKGVYLDATVFVDTDNKDQYNNNGMISQSWKDQQKGEGNILGNAQVFWSDQGHQQTSREPQKQSAAITEDDFGDVPF